MKKFIILCVGLCSISVGAVNLESQNPERLRDRLQFVESSFKASNSRLSELEKETEELRKLVKILKSAESDKPKAEQGKPKLTYYYSS